MTRRSVSVLVALALALAACLPAPDVAPGPVADGSMVAPGPSPAAETAPSGAVEVAVPDPVVSWWGEDPDDLAAHDLAALWALPLQRVDELGRRVPALAASWAVAPAPAEGWAVDVTLAPGEWSDGTPVTALDVVATAEALRGARPAEWAASTGATALDDRTVRLSFDRPYSGWARLFDGPPGVLPAAALADGGLAAWSRSVPVSGGPFALESWDPGVRARWVAHEGSPLGAPGLAELTTLVVPDVDVALGLLDDGVVDAVVGHVALDPRGRAAELDGVEVGVPFGGTVLELAWRSDAGVPVEVRRAAATALDVEPFVDGLLRDIGAPPGGVLPGTGRTETPAAGPADADVQLQLARTVGPLGLLGRLVRRDLGRRGVDVALLRLDPPAHLDARLGPEAVLRVARRAPDHSAAALLAWLGLDPAVGVVADATGTGRVVPSGEGADVPAGWLDVAQQLAEGGQLVQLARVAPTHVWAPARLAGLTPSAWPGLAFADAAAWRAP